MLIYSRTSAKYRQIALQLNQKSAPLARATALLCHASSDLLMTLHGTGLPLVLSVCVYHQNS